MALFEQDIGLYDHHKFIFPFLQEGAEKQAQLERALREKGAVEKELEKVVFTETIIPRALQLCMIAPGMKGFNLSTPYTVDLSGRSFGDH
jgi:hypothetical protein